MHKCPYRLHSSDVCVFGGGGVCGGLCVCGEEGEGCVCGRGAVA